MLARSVFVHLKPNGMVEFARLIETETIPLFRRQRGFQDEITFFVPGGNEALEISLWNRKEDADDYGHRACPKLLKALENVVEGDSEVRIYAVSNSTFHKIAAPDFGRG